MENSFDYSKSILGKELQSQELPFLILPKLKRLIEQIGPSLPQEDYLQTQPQVWIHKTAKVSPNAVILPPCIICQNAEIRTNAYLRGGVVVGANAQVGNCVEIKNTLMFDGVKIPHLSYVGDSILSSNVHLGAGVIISNVRADKGQITHNNIKTGLTKMGAIIHQNAEIGCNAVISPGTLVGQNSRVYPTTLVRGVVPPNSILKNNGQIVPLKPQIQPPKGEKQ